MLATFNCLNRFGRADCSLVPVVPPGEVYVWESKYIVLVQDKVQAMTNTIAEVLPESEIHKAMCIIHASIFWLSVNTGKFSNDIFKRLVKETEEMCLSPFMWFNVLVGWSKAIHII